MSEESYHRRRGALIGLDRTFSRPWTILSEPGVSYRPDIPTPDQALVLILKAMEARSHAKSYRGFTVGAAGRIDRNDDSRFLIKHGANYKNGSDGATINTHAEDMILRRAGPEDHLSLLVVVGNSQEDHGSGRCPPTLHPCHACRGLLRASPSVDDRTVIICATPDGREVEWGTIGDYEAYHAGHPAEGIGRAHFDETPAVLAPLPPVAEAYLIGDGFELDTSEWDEKVARPLALWIGERLV